MVCGLWFVVCGLWCVVCGLWFVVCGLWFVVCGLWFVVSGLSRDRCFVIRLCHEGFGAQDLAAHVGLAQGEPMYM